MPRRSSRVSRRASRRRRRGAAAFIASASLRIRSWRSRANTGIDAVDHQTPHALGRARRYAAGLGGRRIALAILHADLEVGDDRFPRESGRGVGSALRVLQVRRGSSGARSPETESSHPRGPASSQGTRAEARRRSLLALPRDFSNAFRRDTMVWRCGLQYAACPRPSSRSRPARAARPPAALHRRGTWIPPCGRLPGANVTVSRATPSCWSVA